jgi:hypothetical protein
MRLERRGGPGWSPARCRPRPARRRGVVLPRWRGAGRNAHRPPPPHPHLRALHTTPLLSPNRASRGGARSVVKVTSRSVELQVSRVGTVLAARATRCQEVCPHRPGSRRPPRTQQAARLTRVRLADSLGLLASAGGEATVARHSRGDAKGVHCFATPRNVGTGPGQRGRRVAPPHKPTPDRTKPKRPPAEPPPSLAAHPRPEVRQKNAHAPFQTAPTCVSLTPAFSAAGTARQLRGFG